MKNEKPDVLAKLGAKLENVTIEVPAKKFHAFKSIYISFLKHFMDKCYFMLISWLTTKVVKETKLNKSFWFRYGTEYWQWGGSYDIRSRNF